MPQLAQRFSDMYCFYLYDRRRILELLRMTSAQDLERQIASDGLDVALWPGLKPALRDWELRALGSLPLRDALLVDPQRGALFYGQLCAALAVERVALDPPSLDDTGALEQALERMLQTGATNEPSNPETWPAPVAALTEAGGPLAGLVRRARDEQLTPGLERILLPTPLALPAELASLLPPHPQALARTRFEPPTGLRRVLATLLVAVGALWLAAQLLLLDSLPVRPAGVPLALFTLALLVGVRAHWPGYLGSTCIWLVANLPGFHYDTVFSWSSLPLLAVGLLLLTLDRHIRVMWAWLAERYQSRNAIPKK